MISTGIFDNRWVDDYLDLLNYAKFIGDAKWEQDILRKLNHAEHHKGQAALEQRDEVLWLQFDAVNERMLELYRQLRDARNASLAESITEKVWELKARRIEIGRQLNTR